MGANGELLESASFYRMHTGLPGMGAMLESWSQLLFTECIQGRLRNRAESNSWSQLLFTGCIQVDTTANETTYSWSQLLFTECIQGQHDQAD